MVTPEEEKKPGGSAFNRSFVYGAFAVLMFAIAVVLDFAL